MGELNVKFQYPYSDKFEYETYLERINLDEEKLKDLSTDNGFIITSPKTIKKDIRDINGIFSTKFGQGIDDINPFINRYKCQCGHTVSRINHDSLCPVCNTLVQYVDDNFNYFGWITLNDPYAIIHPNLYKSLCSLIGEKKFDRIIKPVDEKDEDGFSVEMKMPPNEPFFGIGIMGLKEKFDVVMEYYKNAVPAKRDVYDDIMRNKDKVFVQSIPVYTTLLRPYKIDGDSLIFEGTNSIYNMMNKLAHSINNDKLRFFKKRKPKNELHYNLQCKYNELYKELENTLSGKKGSIRSLFGGRYNFTARSVITLDPELGIDQIRLSYAVLCELLQQSIINILNKSYYQSYSAAYKQWYIRSMIHMEPEMVKIINSIINNYDYGIPVLVNRNPTINYGSIVRMNCIGINDNYTMSIPYGILTGLAADFDGDTLNILYIINREFAALSDRVLNPRNAMYISKNDGYLNAGVLPMKDTLVNSNTLINLSRDRYSELQLAKIQQLKGMR